MATKKKAAAPAKPPKVAGVKRKPLGDLHETVVEFREELKAGEPAAPKVPRFTPDGILLNPEDFHVGADGVLIPKG